jgi:hypothetical protein
MRGSRPRKNHPRCALYGEFPVKPPQAVIIPNKVTNPLLLFSIRNPKSPITFPSCLSLYTSRVRFIIRTIALIFRELLSRDHEDGRATGQPQGVGSQAYLDGTSQGELVLSAAEGTPEDAGKDGHIRGRSK